MANAQTLTTLHDFTGGADGAAPLSGLVKIGHSLYGTAGWGGIQGANCNNNMGYGTGCGTVFELNPAKAGWSFQLLYRFTGGADGNAPFGTLAKDAHGNSTAPPVGAVPRTQTAATMLVAEPMVTAPCSP